MADERTTGEHPTAPFLTQDRRQQPHLNKPRILEAVIIAVLAGVIGATGSSVLTTVRLEVVLSAQADKLERLEHQVESMRRDMYRPRWDREAMTTLERRHGY